MDNQSDEMTTADWRWAASKGYWDPLHRCWIEEMGGKEEYLAQRNRRRAARTARMERSAAKVIVFNSGSSKTTNRRFLQNSNALVGDVKRQRSENGMTKANCQGEISPHSNMTPPCEVSIPQLSDTIGTIWCQKVCRKYWTRGYRAGPITQAYWDLPHELKFQISEALDSIQMCADAEERLILGASQRDEEMPEYLPADGEQGKEDDIHGFVQVSFAGIPPCSCEIDPAHLFSLFPPA
jgi:hypothetical protein